MIYGHSQFYFILLYFYLHRSSKGIESIEEGFSSLLPPCLCSCLPFWNRRRDSHTNGTILACSLQTQKPARNRLEKISGKLSAYTQYPKVPVVLLYPDFTQLILWGAIHKYVFLETKHIFREWRGTWAILFSMHPVCIMQVQKRCVYVLVLIGRGSTYKTHFAFTEGTQDHKMKMP